MSVGRNATGLLKAQYKRAGEWFMGTMKGVDNEVANFVPEGGKVHPIGAQAAHIIMALDGMVNGMVAQRKPLMMSSFAGKTGVSTPPPMDPNEDWTDWGRSVKVDLKTLHDYAVAVFAQVEEVIESLDDSDLEREVDLKSIGEGKETVAWVFNVMLLNIYSHTGEISAIKGMQGLKGYPA